MPLVEYTPKLELDDNERRAAEYIRQALLNAPEDINVRNMATALLFWFLKLRNQYTYTDPFPVSRVLKKWKPKIPDIVADMREALRLREIEYAVYESVSAEHSVPHETYPKEFGGNVIEFFKRRHEEVRRVIYDEEEEEELCNE